jgi:adenine deaminase
VLAEAVDRGAIIEGHAPNLTGGDLAAYIAAGVTSDHTFVTPELAEERLRAGMTLQLQLKSLAPETIRRASALAKSLNLCLVTDDVMPDDLVRTGHLDHVLRTAIRMGMDPIEAIRAVTIAPAMRFGLTDRGAIAPGRWAHIVLTKSLEDFRADYVFHAGRLVAKDGELIVPLPDYTPPDEARRTVRIAPPPMDRFRLSARGRSVTARIMQMRPDSTYTEARTERLPVRDGVVHWEASDLCLAAVFERHGRAGTIGYGLVRHALRDGAIAMTWAHDSHNLLVLGRSPAEMAQAAKWVVEAGGGMAAVRGGELLGSVRLPIAGIVSDRSVPEVAEELGTFRRALTTLGFTHTSPIMALGVLTLPVSPELKLTDRGLVDVTRGVIVPLIVED